MTGSTPAVQYSGWKMLPGPITAGGAPTMSIDAAARFVAEQAPEFTPKNLIDTEAAWRKAYVAAAKTLHPDVSKDAAAWAKLQDAAQLLNSLHSRK